MNARRSLHVAVVTLFVLSTSFSSSALAGQHPETRPLTSLLQAEQSGPEPDWIVQSAAGGSFGGSLNSAGDVNDDGFDDIIVGDEIFSGGGRAYAYYGSFDGLSTTANWTGVKPSSGYVYYGHTVSSAGDVDGDGYDDVMVSELGEYATQRGKVYLYYGSENGLNTTPGWSREGTVNYEGFGYALDGPCNVNGDAYDDLLITSFNSSNSVGAVFVFYGSGSGPSSEDYMTYESPQPFSKLGTNIACAGDINGDNLDDFIAGASDATGSYVVSGVVWGWYGSSSGLSPFPSRMISGPAPNFHLGYEVEGIGDVNGDTYNDIMVSAQSNYHTYIFHGSSAGLPENFASYNWNHWEGVPSDGFGTTIAGIGDMNVDGYDDFVVGAPNAGGDSRGAFYVYFGSIDGAPVTYTWRADATGPYSFLGISLSSSGDVENDGDVELLAGIQPNTAMAYYGSPAEAISGLSINSSSPDMLGETTYFTATISGGSFVTYAWDFGDGNTGSGPSLSHSFDDPGVYTTVVMATNSLGGQSQDMLVTIFEEMSLPPGDSVTTGDGVIQFTAPVSQTQALTITYTPALTSGHDTSDFDLAGVSFQLQATGPGGVPVITISPPLVVTLHYDANALPPGMDENSLNLYRYDDASGLWVLIPLISRNPAADTISVSLDHFSEFALMTPEKLGIFVPLIMR